MNTTILVGEDDPAVNRLVATALYEQGFDVVSAADGGEALLLIEEHEPIAVILDLAMPDGLTFYRRLRERPSSKEIPVLILSAHGAEEARSELGAQAAMETPVKLDELILTVLRLLSPDRSSVQ